MNKGPRVSPPQAGKPVGLKTLAEYLNLSPATISIVLNESPVAKSIPLATRQRVIAAAKEFNYAPSALARGLRMKRTHTIGIIAPEHSEGYFTRLMAAIETYLIQAGYLYLVVSHLGQPDLLDEYPRVLMGRHVDGVLLINTRLPRELPIPTVAISSHSEFPSVVDVLLDHDEAARITMNHLQALGHKRIAFMKGQPNALDAAPRWDALMKCAQERGIKIEPGNKLVLEHNSWSPDLGYPVVQDLLRRKTDCTAIVCFNDLAAIGAVRALADRELRCPADLSIIGFDDISSAGYCIPRLTTIRQPLAEMGEFAAQSLIRKIESPEWTPRREYTFRPELIERESTGAPAKRRKHSKQAS
jgi:DNA-binding LacI/PurR family transcriptional regulator